MQRGASTGEVRLIVLIHNYEQSEVVVESAMPIQELCCREDPWVDCEHHHLDSSSGCAKKAIAKQAHRVSSLRNIALFNLSHLVRNSFSSSEFSGTAYGIIRFFFLNLWPLSGFSPNCGIPVSVLLLAFCSQVWGTRSPAIRLACGPKCPIRKFLISDPFSIHECARSHICHSLWVHLNQKRLCPG